MPVPKLVFSATQARRGKVFYKGYEKQVVRSMRELGEIALKKSISSYIYGEGVTDGGEACQGHRAGASVIDAGNVMLFDFDKGIELAVLEEKLAGVSAWIGGSKTDGKFHVVIAIDRPLPLDKEEFARWHRAVAQMLDLADDHDPAMEGWVQQLAPSLRDDAPFVVIDGKPLEMATAMALYQQPEKVAHESGGIDGEISEGEFTLSKTGEKLSVTEMLERVAGGKKVRVHCLKGLEHDGRRDTALVRGLDGGEAIYHCSGGRCGETLLLVNPRPFDEIEEESSVEDIILSHPVHCNALINPKAKDKQRESAIAYAAQELLGDVRLVSNYPHSWNGKMWEPIFEHPNQLSRYVQGLMEQAGFDVLAHSNSAVNSVASLLSKTIPVAKSDDRRNLINLQNGMLDVETMTLMPHDRELLFTSCLPFDYDPQATCPEWERIVQRIMLGSDQLVMALQDALGYVFARTLFLEIMIGLVGTGANGKSTVIEVLHKLVGKDGASRVSLHLLTKPSGEGAYARAQMAGKIVNMTSELSPAALMSNEFKEIVSGVEINARNPYGLPFTIPIAPKQVCAMNSTQGLIKEKTHGFMRRLHLIPFAYTVKEEDIDPYLHKKLEAELSGILNWVLVGTQRVIANRRLTKAAEMDALLDKVARDNDPARQFLEEATETHLIDAESVKPRNTIAKKVVGVNELYAAYKEFCDLNGYRPLGRNAFASDIEQLGAVKINKTIKASGEVTRVYGFYLKLLPKGEWGEKMPRPNLKLVT